MQFRLSLLVLAHPSVKKTATRMTFGDGGMLWICVYPACRPDCAKVAPPKVKFSTALLIGESNDVVICTSVEATVEKLISAMLSILSSK